MALRKKLDGATSAATKVHGKLEERKERLEHLAAATEKKTPVTNPPKRPAQKRTAVIQEPETYPDDEPKTTAGKVLAELEETKKVVQAKLAGQVQGVLDKGENMTDLSNRVNQLASEGGVFKQNPARQPKADPVVSKKRSSLWCCGLFSCLGGEKSAEPATEKSALLGKRPANK